MIQKNGITLITLIITIVLLLILTGVSISVGEDTLGKTQKMRFETDLRIINTKVSELVEEKTLEELNALGKNVPDKASTALGDKSSEGFRYFDKEGLETLGIQNIDREVIINFSTKEVIEINGIDNDGTMIYILKDWVDPSLNDDNTEAPTFNLSKKIYGLNATISIKDIEYKGKSNRGTISYKLNDGIWNEINGNEIPVTVSGTYTIKVTDSSNNSTEKTIEIVLTNQPKLDSGMVPVVYVEAGENESEGHWEIADENGGIWYDYASDSAKWANVMLLDGLTVDVNGTDITVTNENKALLAGKEVTTLGSMFVWIPRYMYKIPYQNFHTSNAAEIGIKFLKGTTNVATDNTNEPIADPYAESIPVPTEQNNPWIIHPAFTDGSKTNYSHGGWDKEITGIWVAKFEASSSNIIEQGSNPSSVNQNDANLHVKIIPSSKTNPVWSWTDIRTTTAFEACKNMKNAGMALENATLSEPHLIKNTEWGAIVYLTQSKYGQIRDGANGQVYFNNYKPIANKEYSQPGFSGIEIKSSVTSNVNDVYEYNTENGVKASTTANIYGIYDLSGGEWDRTASFLNYSNVDNNDKVTKLVEAVNNVTTAKYVDVYEPDLIKEEESGASSNEKRTANYAKLIRETNLLKWGDAIYETSSSGIKYYSWQNGNSLFMQSSNPTIHRGASVNEEQNVGMFAFNNSEGSAISYGGFRPTIIVK